MNKKNILLVILLILVVILSVFAIFIGMKAVNSDNVNSNSSSNAPENGKTFSMTLDDIYSNVKNSKRIVKVNLSIETYNEKDLELFNSKEYLIRDNINQIIRNKTEEELEGQDGQLMLQDEIKNTLATLFSEDSIANIYFNDFVMQ